MYQFSRVHLESVGPPTARFDPLTLSFADEATTKPLDTLIWLVNTGGKGVLLKLIFQVIRPDKVKLIGADRTDHSGYRAGIQPFVRPTDVSHVAIEWVGADGRKLVTGVVMEWRNHHAGASGELRKAWYSFAPVRGLLTLDMLAELSKRDGRRVSYTTFVASLRELAREPRLNLTVDEGQRNWLAQLGRLGIDPDVYEYQLKMNRDEGGVERLFQFAKEIEFIGFLLDLVHDRQQIEQVSENLDRLSEKVARLPERRVELEFVSGALAYVSHLADAEQARQERECERSAAETRATRLRAAFLRRAESDTARAATLTAEAERYEAEKIEHGRVRRAAAARINELRRLIAALRLNEAAEAFGLAKNEADAARVERDAWAATSPLSQALSASARVETLQGQLEAQDAEAAPLRERLAAAETDYAARLEHEISGHRAAAATASKAAEDARDRERELRAAVAASETKAVVLQGKREQLERDQAQLDAQRVTFRDEGLLARAETVAAALERHQAQRQAARKRVAEIVGLITRHEERQKALERSALELATQEQELRARKSGLLDERQAIEDEQAALSEVERLAELQDGALPDLEISGQLLVEALRTAIAEAEREQIGAEAASLDDRRVLRALEHDGMLPPSLDLVAALSCLEAAGIPATSGWRYLVEMAPQERTRLLEQRPELAGAVVITDPLKRERAEAALVDAGLEPRSIVLVATAEELLRRDTHGGRFAVPPSRALYDATAAKQAEELLGARLGILDGKRDELATRRQTDFALAQRLQTFLDGTPFLRLRTIAADLLMAANEEEALAAAITDIAAEREAITTGVTALRNEQQLLQDEQERLGIAETRLSAVADAEASEEQRLNETSALRDEETQERRNASEALLEADEAQNRQEGEAERATQRRIAAERLKGDLDRAGISAAPAGYPVPGVPLETLHARWREADGLLRHATSDSELAIRLRAAHEEEQRARQQCASFSEQALSRAEELLRGEEASDRIAREEALARAGQLFDACEKERLRCENAAEEAAKQSAAVEVELVNEPRIELPSRPETVADGSALLAREEELSREERRQETEFERFEDDVRKDHSLLLTEITQFRDWSDLIGNNLGLDGGADDEALEESYSREAAEATSDVREMFASLTTSKNLLAEAEEKARIQIDTLRKFVLDPRFEPLSHSPLVARLGHDLASDLAARAGQYFEELRRRELNLQAELNELQKHKLAAVEALAGIVETARKQLDSAQKLSRLPASLGEWGGKEFLRIAYRWPDNDDEFKAHLNVVVEDIANGQLKQRGIPLLVHALEAVTGRNGFGVTVLKPTLGGQGERISVTETGGASSGGQGATLAILLYCTLCNLRAHNRGQRSARSTLLLDNPFGKASASSLIAKQRAVAAANGIQLIYTTGVNDFGAVSHFPNPIRLRNDLELRRNMRYVRIDDDQRESILNGREGVDEGFLDATRVYERDGAA